MSTTGKEYKLAIRIAGIIDKSFTTSLATSRVALNRTVTAINSDFTRLDKGFNSIMRTGQKCFSAMATAAGVAAVAITAATAAAIAVGTEFETAFAGVKKTVDATEEEYERLRQDILEMTKTIPSSAAEIADVMTIAGQLGISTDALTDFTETMINLGVSTTMSAEDAATALARFANIMTMENYGADGISNYERLGSTIVDLGNNFATTEEEIVNIATALAAAGDLAGMSEADIMGISAAMSSVGLTAEAGASSMSRLFMQMQEAVATGGDDLAGYAEVVGMTTKEFSSLFREDAAGAVIEFIEGLNEAGEGSYKILDDLDLNTIRLRKSFLSLAGADDLLVNAIDMANEAWDENTALAIEAGKRYETTASQLQLMVNSFKRLGIAAYDDLREPFVDTIGSITDKVDGFTEYVSGPNGIGEWLDSIGETFPTLKRQFNKYAEPVFGFITDTGKWLVKNGAGVITVLAGIGGTMAAYKLVSSGVHFVSFLLTLAGMNPLTWGLLSLVGIIGSITAALTAYKLYENALKNDSLSEHFGRIALSMEELQKVAEYILDAGSLSGVNEALGAFSELDTIASTMENAIAEIDKMNWKVSIGMKLTEEEQGAYKTSIDEYVAAAQDYVLQSKYAVSLNLAVGLGDSAEGANIASKVNQFYQASYDEMTLLGQELSDAVNEAFADNVLNAKEIEAIADLQAKMADVQKSLATGEFEATLSMLSLDYTSGGGLDADSFKNLQEELNKQIATASEAYRESFTKNYASVTASHKSGYLTDAEFKSAIALLEEEYLQSIADLNAKSASFQVDTILGAYSEELSGNVKAIQESIVSELEEMMNSGYGTAEGWQMGLNQAFYDTFSSIDISKADKLALEDLYNTLQPQLEQLEDLAARYTAAGKEIPEEISTAMSNIYSIGAVAGDGSAMWKLFGEEIVKNEEYATVLALAQEAGGGIPQEIMDAMTAEGVMAEISSNVNYILESIKTGLQEGVEVTIPVTYELVTSGINSKDAGISASDININAEGINHRATGGLATRPELTWFAENGPEMAIPIDGSQNAISLWEQTGRLLGMESALDGLDFGSSSSSPTIEYKPTLQFYGSAPSQSDLQEALTVSQDEFESLMERYFKTHGRVSFG